MGTKGLEKVYGNKPPMAEGCSIGPKAMKWQALMQGSLAIHQGIAAADKVCRVERKLGDCVV